MDLSILAIPAALRLTSAAATGLRQASDSFADVLAKLGDGGSTAADAGTQDLPQSAGQRENAVRDFFASIGLDWRQMVDWDHVQQSIRGIDQSVAEPWQRTAIGRWREDNPQFFGSV